MYARERRKSAALEEYWLPAAIAAGYVRSLNSGWRAASSSEAAALSAVRDLFSQAYADARRGHRGTTEGEKAAAALLEAHNYRGVSMLAECDRRMALLTPERLREPAHRTRLEPLVRAMERMAQEK